MQSYYLLSSDAGTELVLAETPWWALAIATLAEAACAATGHFFCSGGPEWALKVPLGRPQYREGELLNSLADGIYTAFGRVMELPYRHERVVARLKVSAEIVEALSPTQED
jgi:hypothetical protein